MPAIARRALLLLPFVLRADDVFDLFASLASALSEGNAAAFLSAFDPDMPDYGTLQANVTALCALGNVTTSIEVLSSRDGKVELDWLLQIGSERRRQVVRCTVARIRKGLKIKSLSPVGFLAPPRPGTGGRS